MSFREVWREEEEFFICQVACFLMSLTTHVLCYAKSLQSCPTLCDPTDCSPPGSSVRGILQARILERVAISFSRASSPPRDRTRLSGGGFFSAEPSGEP